MITHSDKEFEFLVNLLVQQRDHAMGQAAALYKENVALKTQMKELSNQESKDASNSDSNN